MEKSTRFTSSPIKPKTSGTLSVSMSDIVQDPMGLSKRVSSPFDLKSASFRSHGLPGLIDEDQ